MTLPWSLTLHKLQLPNNYSVNVPCCYEKGWRQSRKNICIVSSGLGCPSMQFCWACIDLDTATIITLRDSVSWVGFWSCMNSFSCQSDLHPPLIYSNGLIFQLLLFIFAFLVLSALHPNCCSGHNLSGRGRLHLKFQWTYYR